MNWRVIRGIGYLAALGAGVAVVALNWGTFDPQTGVLDLHPFNVFEALGALWAAVGAPAVALVAVARGWGRR